jgi:hypothetical protein
MIEGDARLKLPLCYQLVALPYFDRIAECRRIVERAYDSALEFGSMTGQTAARNAFNNMVHIERLVQLYRLDLETKIDSDKADIVDRSWLLDWAYSVHNVDIFGTQARQRQGDSDKRDSDGFSVAIPTTPTLEESAKWAEGHLLSGDRLRREVFGEPPTPKPEFTERQKLFLSIAWLIDELLTKRNGQWRNILQDPNDKASSGFLINGRLNANTLAQSVVDQLPEGLGGKDASKAIKGHISFVMHYLTPGLDQVSEFSKKASPHAYRTLYGLARAVWKAKTGQAVPDRRTVQYPVDCTTVLAADVTEATPLSPDELKDCLEKALEATTRLYPTVSR